METILEFIFGLINLKDSKDPEYNDFLNTLIVLLTFFGIFIVFLYVCSKLGLFGKLS